jgi:hypothetical protein
MLLERGMPKEALAAFEATLKKEPNRLGATLGAGTSAREGALVLHGWGCSYGECGSGQAADRAGARVCSKKRALTGVADWRRNYCKCLVD